MTENRTEMSPNGTLTIPPRPTEQEGIGRGRATALLVAAVTLSVVASMIATAGRGSAPAPAQAAPAADTAAAQPAADTGADTQAAADAAPATAPAIFRDPTDVGTPVGDRGPTTVSYTLTTKELEGQLADGTTYTYWTFDGTVPGPMMRARVGDTIKVTLKNAPDSTMTHSIDMHAVNGPGGGAAVLKVAPGESKTLSFKALYPGLYVYHCATPHIPSHIANGMFGMVLVEPEGGLAPVDHEFYLMQSEIYTAEPRGTKGHVTYDADKMMNEDPTYVVFNGTFKGLTGDNAMQAKVGDTVRVFFGDAGPNLISSFHVIGEIMDNVHVEGGTLVNHNVQTTAVPAGGATWAEFTINEPGDYILLDHAITRAMDAGAMAILHAEGAPDRSIYDAEGWPAAPADTPADAPADTAKNDTAPAAADGTVTVGMTEFAFDLSSDTAKAGTVSFDLQNNGQIEHEFFIASADTPDAPLAKKTLAAGESGQVSLDLPAGTYEIACHIPGHYEAGMKTTLTVS